MKISATTTHTIAIKAMTQSEWDSIDFAILHISDKTISVMKERLALLEMVKSSTNFSGLSFWEDPDGWYINNQQDTALETIDLDFEDKDWCYLEMTDEEEETLTSPEQYINNVHLKVNADGSMKFVGYGKHTGEEFWTADVPMGTLIENF